MAEEEEMDTCPICFKTCVDVSHPSSCRHKFCLDCIKKWQSTKTSTHVVCPMCKRESKALVYNYDCNTSTFDLYFFDQTIKSIVLSKAHRTRLSYYMVEKSISHSTVEEVNRFWERRLFVQPKPTIFEWLRRELQALTRIEDTTDVVAHYINSIVEKFFSRHKKNEETVTVELSKQFKQLVSTAVSKFVPDGEEDRFSEELECFVASKLSIEAYDLSYEESSKEGQNGVDYDLLRWIQQKVNLMQIQNTDFLSTRCLNFAREVRSHAELEIRLVNELGFPPSKQTLGFARSLFDKLSSTQELDQSCNIKHEDYKKEVYTQDAYTLLSLGVLDHEGNVTRFGMMMKRLQVGPMLARMIESSEKYGCGEEIIKIAAMVSSRANAHRTPVSRSDHMSMLVAYESWEATNFSKKWCLDNGVQLAKMEHAKSLIHKWDKTLESLQIKVTSKRDDVQCIKRCVIEGYISTCAKFQSDGTYKSLKAPYATKRIDPTSTLYEWHLLPRFVVHSDTFTNSMQEVTEITLKGLSKVAPELYRLAGIIFLFLGHDFFSYVTEELTDIVDHAEQHHHIIVCFVYTYSRCWTGEVTLVKNNTPNASFIAGKNHSRKESLRYICKDLYTWKYESSSRHKTVTYLVNGPSNKIDDFSKTKVNVQYEYNTIRAGSNLLRALGQN
ncbi:unnamed protein product [Brassica oleracea]